MRASFSRWSVIGAVLGSLLFGISGCKSGATAPTDWLSWGKKPSATALSATAPKKPSSTLPNPRTTTGAQPGLANNGYANYGNQGYTAPAGGTAAATGYTTGQYGMASNSTTGSQAGASQYGLASTNGYGADPSQYARQASTQPGSYQTSEQPYRTADARSAGGYDVAPSGYGGQQSTGAAGYGQPAPQNWETQAASNYPAGGTTDTTGLSSSAGAYQPGSTGAAGALPVSGATSQNPAPNNYPGSTPPTNYPSSTGSGSSNYPSGNLQTSPPGAYPTSNYSPTNSGSYPTTNSGAPGYTSPYPSTTR